MWGTTFGRALAPGLAVACAAAVALAPPVAADPDALWHIVSGECVPHQLSTRDPSPCAQVEPGPDGYAVLKDLVGATQYLLIPTARVDGIESPQLLQPGSPNYLADAWRARTFVEARAGTPLPRDWVGLAINSAEARTQDQLHVHVDCIRADVHDALARHPVGPGWAPFPEPLAGAGYLAMAVDDLDAVNPFALLADGVPGARADMGAHTLAVVGAYLPDGRPGFVLLANSAGPEASSEDLQDHDACPPPHGAWAK